MQYKVKDKANKDEGLRLAWNARYWANKFKEQLGGFNHEAKEKSEKELDIWLKENVLPEEKKLAD